MEKTPEQLAKKPVVNEALYGHFDNEPEPEPEAKAESEAKAKPVNKAGGKK